MAPTKPEHLAELYEILKLPLSGPSRDVTLANFQASPQTKQVANLIMLNANVDWGKAGSSQPQKPLKEQGFNPLSWFLDKLFRPGWGSAEAARSVSEYTAERDVDTPLEALESAPGALVAGISGFGRGFSGKAKTTYSDVYQQMKQAEKAEKETGNKANFRAYDDLKINPIEKHGLGFLGDVALDPLNVIPFGAIAKLAGKGARAAGLAKPAREIPTPPVREPGIAPTKEIIENLKSGKSESFPVAQNIPQAFKGAEGSKVTPDIQFQPSGLDIPKAPGKIQTLPPLEALSAVRPLYAKSNTLRFQRNVPPSTAKAFGSSSDEFIEQLAREGVPKPKSTPKVEVPNPAKPIEVMTAARVAEEYHQNILSKPNKWRARVLFNPAQQANLFTNLIEASKKLAPPGVQKGGSKTLRPRRYTISLRMMKEAEDYLIAKGIPPRYWDGLPLRMTDVVAALGRQGIKPKDLHETYIPMLQVAFKEGATAKIKDPKILQAIEDVRSGAAFKEAQYIDEAVDAATGAKAIVDETLPPPRAKSFKQFIDKDLKFKARSELLSEPSMKTMTSLLKDIERMSVTEVQKVIDDLEGMIAGHVSAGKYTNAQGQINAKMSRKIQKLLGASYAQLAKNIGPADNKAVEGIMTRMTTWFGQKDLRPHVMDRMQTAHANTYARGRFLEGLRKRYSPVVLKEAFEVAQGVNKPGLSDEIQEAAQYFRDYMEGMFKSSGLSDEAANASTVALRSGMLMDDINNHLGHLLTQFRFTNKPQKNLLGETQPYHEGTNWLNSWETWKVDDPIKFIYQVDLAVERTLKEYAVLDEVAARYGSHIRHKEFQHLAGHPRLKGTYFPADIVTQVNRVINDFQHFYNPNSTLMKNYDKVLRTWKTSVTIYFPSHHIRNANGDIYLSWMAGVNSPRPYKLAAKVLHSQRGKYKTLPAIETLTDKNAIAIALTQPGDILITMRNGQKLTANQIYVAAHHHGLIQDPHVIEDIFGGKLINWKPLGGKGEDLASGVAKTREHGIRLAHFIDVLSKTKEPDLAKAFADASHTVRRWHPDGMDLTDFERKFMRRIMPFYSWTRKAIPLLIESAVTKPAKTAVFPKGMYSIQGMVGIESPSAADPFPEDTMFPEWIREKGIGPVFDPGENISLFGKPVFRDNPPGYSIINPSNPTFDIASQFANPVKGALSMGTPAFKIPAELMTGQRAVGAPVEWSDPGSMLEYAGEQVPPLALLQRTGGVGLGGETTRAEKDEKRMNMESILNYLTAGGFRGTGPYERQAIFEYTDAMKKKARGG